MADEFKVSVLRTEQEAADLRDFAQLFRSLDWGPDDLIVNLAMFVRRQDWARHLYLHELYRLALPVQGVVMEFGTRWGQNLALLSAFRSIYEPYNFTRKVIGFDTFAGYTQTSDKDGPEAEDGEGMYSVLPGWKQTLEWILEFHESQAPLPHLRKFEVIEGDARDSVPEYLHSHPETVISLALFDMDIYQPTFVTLEAIRPFLTRGSVISLGQLSLDIRPGATVAVREALGIDQISLRRMNFSPSASYLVWEG